ncbi:hypothetical protein IMSHALPRED_009200 [Imshaugia aleurites]|uniref:3'-5' exonuclease domain-containing protein n=1 Tax=Imshaugia aleurites TaxID=172621 RepID=A0A8H3IBX2_9LECA|nr:hypothetical protein IMSHALPRED_009200 [Imshaugia aleurites]
MKSNLIDSPASIATLINTIVNLPTNPPSLYLDLEGINLSRLDSISILQLLLHPQNHVYLIDIHVLGTAAFTTPGSGGTTLQSILESPTIPKVFFDVRNDSNALFLHHGIALQGVQDVQLMECASRAGVGFSRKFLHCLRRCITTDAPIAVQQKQTWTAVEAAGTMLYAPQKGGSYGIFNERPLREEIRAYCVQDVQFLPVLRQTYCGRLQPIWEARVDVETTARVQLSQTRAYQPQGPDKAFSPWKDIQAGSVFI